MNQNESFDNIYMVSSERTNSSAFTYIRDEQSNKDVLSLQLNSHQKEQSKKEQSLLINSPNKTKEFLRSLRSKKVGIGNLKFLEEELDQSQYGNQEVVSESIQEQLQQSSTYSEIKALQQRKQMEIQKKPFVLNIMVAGSTGLGKTTFVESILRKRMKLYNIIQPTTSQIYEIGGQIVQEQFTMNLKFIDTPGYRDSYCQKQWFKMIKSYIVGKNKLYQEWQYEQYTSKDEFRRNEFINHDERVHACLYFFSGPRIKVEDLQILKKLSKIVNVIPILARGDSYTGQEVKLIKTQFCKEIKDYDIEIFDCLSCKQLPHDIKQRLIDGPFGSSPPFLLVCSVEEYEVQPGRLVQGRQFAWGFCEIYNPSHSDFILLQKLLIGHISQDLVNMTNFIFQIYLNRMNKKKDKKSKTKQSWLNCLLSKFKN